MAGEIEAMAAIDQALKELDEEERHRVLRWALDKFGGGQIGSDTSGKEDRRASDDHGARVSTFERIVDLVDAASPATTVDHVLVASYWFQIIRGQESFGSQEVNSALKDLGHGAKNITDAYDSLMTRKPPAVRQMQKSGSSKQARKRYRLTEAGIRTVERMLNPPPEE